MIDDWSECARAACLQFELVFQNALVHVVLVLTEGKSLSFQRQVTLCHPSLPGATPSPPPSPLLASAKPL